MIDDNQIEPIFFSMEGPFQSILPYVRGIPVKIYGKDSRKKVAQKVKSAIYENKCQFMEKYSC